MPIINYIVLYIKSNKKATIASKSDDVSMQTNANTAAKHVLIYSNEAPFSL